MLTYASPLAICFSGEGWLLSCTALNVYWLFPAWHCLLLIQISTAVASRVTRRWCNDSDSLACHFISFCATCNEFPPLQIKNLSLEDADVYKCIASNKHGEAIYSVTLTVTESKSFTILCVNLSWSCFQFSWGAVFTQRLRWRCSVVVSRSSVGLQKDAEETVGTCCLILAVTSTKPVKVWWSFL